VRKDKPVLVVFTKEGSDAEKRGENDRSPTKRLTKAPSTDGAGRRARSTGDRRRPKKLGPSAREGDCTSRARRLRDRVRQARQAPSADALVKLLKTAQDATPRRRRSRRIETAGLAPPRRSRGKTPRPPASSRPTLESRRRRVPATDDEGAKLVDELTEKGAPPRQGSPRRPRPELRAGAQAHLRGNAKYPIPRSRRTPRRRRRSSRRRSGAQPLRSQSLKGLAAHDLRQVASVFCRH